MTGDNGPTTISVAMSTYENTLAAVRQAITVSADVGSWLEDATAPIRARCTNSEGTRGEVRSTGHWIAGPIAEQGWPAARDAALAAARDSGFGTVETIRDFRSDRVLAVQGPDGSVLNLSTGAKTVVDIRSGCHPIDEKSPK